MSSEDQALIRRSNTKLTLTHHPIGSATATETKTVAARLIAVDDRLVDGNTIHYGDVNILIAAGDGFSGVREAGHVLVTDADGVEMSVIRIHQVYDLDGNLTAYRLLARTTP